MYMAARRAAILRQSQPKFSAATHWNYSGPVRGYLTKRNESRMAPVLAVSNTSFSRGFAVSSATDTNRTGRHVIGALVQNEQGVLAGVANLFAGRGYNIDSLVVGRTEIPELSRITIVVLDSADNMTQIAKQLQDVTQVVMVAVASPDKGIVERDLMMIKVRSETKTDRIGLIQLGNVFSAKVVDVLEKHIMFELSAHPQEIERFIDLCGPYGIVEIARTGVVGMAREAAAFTSLIQDGALVQERLLEKLEMDATALPPG